MAPGDEQRLHQVVTNLLNNARRHTPPGTTVRVGVGAGAEPGRVSLWVQDDGPGMSPELVRTAFERFTRGDSSRTRESGGAGLGLSLVQAIATAHGGTVSVTSEPGRTRFELQLPALAGADSQSEDRVTTRACQSASRQSSHEQPDPHLDAPEVRPPGGSRSSPRDRTHGFRRSGPAARRPRPGRHDRPPDLARPHRGPPVGPARPARSPRRHRGALPVGARGVRVGQLVLLGSRPGGIRVLEGVPLRLLGRRELDHRRQDADVAVGDGAVGAGLRPVVVGHPGPAGADGRRVGRPPARHRPAYDGVGGRRTHRRRRARDDARRGADVPLQQPRRDAGAAPRRLGRRHGPRHRVHAGPGRGPHRPPGPLDRARRRAGRVRVPDQDAPGVPGAAAAGPGVPRRRAHLARQARRPPARGVRLDAAGRRLVDRARRALAGRVTPLHRRLADQLDPRAHPGLQRLRPPHRRRDRLGRRRRRAAAGAPPASCGCSTPRSAARSPGCCRPR